MADSQGEKPQDRTDCVIFTTDPPSRRGLKVLQVIERLTYYREEEKVDIVLDVFTKHDGDKPLRYRVVHRGWATATLHAFQVGKTGDEKQRIFSQLYADRINKNPSDPQTLLFFPRVNCFGTSQEATTVSLLGPGGCFEQLEDGITLDPEIPTGPGAAFTSFLLPPPGCSEIMPGECAVCRITLSLPKETYRRFVASDQFTVESYSRLLRCIETYDLQHADKAQVDLYDRSMRSREAVIKPERYDIVIHQHPGGVVVAERGSTSITPARIHDEQLAEKVLWFFGEPAEFNLKLRFRKNGSASQKQIKKRRRNAKQPIQLPAEVART
jgi:hypothetical protein